MGKTCVCGAEELEVDIPGRKLTAPLASPRDFGEECVELPVPELPGPMSASLTVRLNGRATGPEAVVYAASVALWQRRLAAQADAVVVPSCCRPRV